MTPVLMAICVQNKNLATILIEKGADLNTPAEDVRKRSIYSDYYHSSKS